MSRPDNSPAAESMPAGAASLQRDLNLYHMAPDASGGLWNLAQVCQEFDSPSGDLTESLIDGLNAWAAGTEDLNKYRLAAGELRPLPRQILILDGSPNRLPLSPETSRITSALVAERGWDIPVFVVNRREELVARVSQAPQESLVLSQACLRSLFDVELAESLKERGAVVVPGPLTAPGGPLSNKRYTYELLAENSALSGEHTIPPLPLTARYKTALVYEGRPGHLAETILKEAMLLAAQWKSSAFFVKPQEGGGGRGCFRLDILPEGFVLPDLSRLNPETRHTIPLPLNLDPEDSENLRVLKWMLKRYASSPATADAYIHDSFERNPSLQQMAKILREGTLRLRERFRRHAVPFSEAHRRLTQAIDSYQHFYGVPYRPLICEWVDFGFFGIRAHLRIGRRGPALESLYARLFPLAFGPEGIGFVGVDSITNQKGGGMELNRYTPLTPQMVRSVGGPEALSRNIRTAFYAFTRILSLLPAEEWRRLPIRAEFDLSPINGLIVEGNADPVRAQCANSRWDRFHLNTRTWTEDALSYYAWKLANG